MAESISESVVNRNDTSVCVVDDYTFSIVSPQPVLTMFALFPPAAPVEAPVEDVVVEEVAKAKVVKAPAKAAAEVTEGVETK